VWPDGCTECDLSRDCIEGAGLIGQSLPAEDRAVTLCEKCDGSGFVHDADGMEDNCDCGALNARMKADQQRGEDRAVTAPPVPPPADARWFPDPPPGPSRAVTAPQEPDVVGHPAVAAIKQQLAAGMQNFYAGEVRILLAVIERLRSERDEAQLAAAQWREQLAAAKVKLAALIHAIEALREELETLKATKKEI
jgi:hypothetical protein